MENSVPENIKTIEIMTIEELKAVCYDQILRFNQAQQNINIIQ
jgi:hypothetical protein